MNLLGMEDKDSPLHRRKSIPYCKRNEYSLSMRNIIWSLINMYCYRGFGGFCLKSHLLDSIVEDARFLSLRFLPCGEENDSKKNMNGFLWRVASRSFGIERLPMVVCWEFVCFVGVRELLGWLVCGFMLVRFVSVVWVSCECRLMLL